MRSAQVAIALLVGAGGVFAIQQKLVASAMREDDKIACVGKNVAREIRLCTSGAMIRVSFPMVKQAQRRSQEEDCEL
jgi:hypothetical protein